MTHNEDVTDTKAHHLIEAIGQVGDAVWKIEVWANALRAFTLSVPVYEPGNWIQRLGSSVHAS
jgi:hypothetical protein